MGVDRILRRVYNLFRLKFEPFWKGRCIVFLDKKITRLVLQFFVDSLNQIPDVLMNEERPCPTERPRRTNDGELTINHQRNCSAENFIFELESAGYMLVDVNWQKRRRAEKPYYVIRCFFLKREKVRPSRRLEIVGGLFRPAVLHMLTSAKWEI